LVADVEAQDSSDGAWIFVSHSHRDLSEVRRVRDALEAKGHQPLLFFLKCLNDDAEIDDLVRREIEVRQFFLLCDSPNARTSRWVQEEVRLIGELRDKVRVDVALDGDWQAQLERIDEISRRATVFLSYSSGSKDSVRIARALADALRARDYRVFLDVDSIPAGSLWSAEVQNALDAALDHGFVLVLLSPEALESEFVVAEVKHALERSDAERSTRVIPIVASRVDLTFDSLERLGLEAIARRQMLDFTVGDLDDNVSSLIRILTQL
jgi:hypothetical protein